MRNPYDVLGVKEDCTEDELKKAYKSLARKYHPDVNSSPEASQKMVEINCAYDEIKKMRENGQTFSSYAAQNDHYDNYSAYQQANGYQDAYNNAAFQSQMFARVERAIQANCYYEAFTILQSMPIRNGKWFYYMAIVYAQTGNVNAAKQLIDQAIVLEPNNQVYISYKTKLDQIKVDDFYHPYRVIRIINLRIIIRLIGFLLFIFLVLMLIISIGNGGR